ncbi:hypothetical protein Shyhy02_24820 [Streptomyces hygroscopicus subsp. hygroscopicus]|nr:hypothetical protein Shyhy02_24820 [Streptomyces hygroscopicus subsp. hygroscopicus]
MAPGSSQGPVCGGRAVSSMRWTVMSPTVQEGMARDGDAFMVRRFLGSRVSVEVAAAGALKPSATLKAIDLL